MLAVRQRAVRLALRARPVRSQQRHSSSHGHEHAHHEHAAPVNESFGPGFYMLAAALPAGITLYQLSQPDANGTQPAITRYLQQYMALGDLWEERNKGHVAAVEEAARDRLLFFHQPRPHHYEVREIESLFAGSQRCVPPSMNVNLDKVTEHYRNLHHEDEARKARALASKAAASA
ncbi:NADH ubiquinone reductase H+-translocating [Ceratocystis lukuohia]|uniref:NADH-ubiquinone oxidoreductase 17.8 kDa subunit, mitochondrial n=2 Tax=Ceratocystis TaxID=5157 RepID=A0A2C5X3J5_9PEZI|nr:NADH-ubiquinone oxidoreductase 17.8 kDa subunit, mitochondrial [Ceratocystis fimbriata CBS 114723]